MTENKGKIDTTLAEAFLSDHYDTFTKKEAANRRTLCGHGDVASPANRVTQRSRTIRLARSKAK